MDEHTLIRYCMNANITTANTKKVMVTKLKYMQYVENGTLDEFKRLIVDMIGRGNRQSYIRSVINALRKEHYKRNNGWDDPFKEIGNKRLISNTFINFRKLQRGGGTSDKLTFSASLPRLNVVDEAEMGKIYAVVKSALDYPLTVDDAHYQFCILFACLYWSGCRLCEFMNMTLTQSHTLLSEKSLNIVGKSLSITIKLPDNFLPMLHTYVKYRQKRHLDNDKLFTVTEKTMRRQFDAIYKVTLGTDRPEGVGFHSIRKYAAIRMYREDPLCAASLLNHRDLHTTERYYVGPMAKGDYVRNNLNKLFDSTIKPS